MLRKSKSKRLRIPPSEKQEHFTARLQPNHPTDNVDGIMASVMEGLSYGVGDAVIGLNPGR